MVLAFGSGERFRGQSPQWVRRRGDYPMREFLSVDHVQANLHLVRGHRVLLHPELARLYRVTPGRLLAEAERFPGDFRFQVEHPEVLAFAEDRRDQSHALYAFTEHGALVVAYLLATPDAIAASVTVTRAFVQMRQRTPRPDSWATGDGLAQANLRF
jgi:hypothetical protein